MQENELTPERWAQVRALLELALERPERERAAFLAASGSDPEIVAATERLLGFEQQASAAFAIESWQIRAQGTVQEHDLAGTVAGSYRLLRELGRGGMGAVYLAERADGIYQQKVAVKILQEGIFTDALAERFRQERQILARLTHPGIARLLDGGVLPDGRPYLVLEYVDGIPIDRFCTEHRLSLPERLRLFVRVAEVVQSAHQQLILHLDLKPANILVTPQGEPRLLDFGLARILSEADTRTEATLRLLTPRFASPEQAAGAPLGVASDVFSLATLLYKLLTGTLPYPIEDATPLAALRMLNDTAPTLPSAIAPALRGDLDTILLQALRKEPERRYATVAALRDDVQRSLDSRPVLAHKDSLRYRTAKFVRRNRFSVAAAVAVLLVVVASGVAVVHSALVARRERAAAERHLHDIQNLTRFYVTDLFDILHDIPGTLPVRKLMAEKAVIYLKSMSEERDGDPAFSVDMANGLYEMAKVEGFPIQPSMGDLRGAQSVLNLAREMVELHARQMPNDPKTPARRGLLDASQANITSALGDVAGAVALERKAWDEVQPVLQGPKSNRWMQISTYCLYNATYLATGDQFTMADPVEALRWIDRGEALLLDLGKAKPEFLTMSLYRTQLAGMRHTKGSLLAQLHRDAEARRYFEQSLHELEAASSDGTIEATATLRDSRRLYAAFLLDRGELDKAAAISAPLRPRDHPMVQAGKDTFDMEQYGLQTHWWAILSAHAGRKAEALDNVSNSLAVTRQLMQEAPENRKFAGQHAISLVAFAELPGIPAEQVRALLGEAIALTAGFSREHPSVLSSQLLEARAHLTLARLAAEADRKAEAARAAALLEAIVRQRPGSVEPAALLATARELAR